MRGAERNLRPYRDLPFDDEHVHRISDEELAIAKSLFLAISQTAAQRTIRFMKVRDVAKVRLSEVAK